MKLEESGTRVSVMNKSGGIIKCVKQRGNKVYRKNPQLNTKEIQYPE